MKTKEEQIGELLANSVEDHFFNPAALGRYLAEQPTYTLDRVMEVVAWVIEKQARRYDREVETGGMVSEGLAIAHKLDKVIDKIKISNDFKNIKLGSDDKNCNKSWMICTARQSIKKHWLKAGLWILKNKFLG